MFALKARFAAYSARIFALIFLALTLSACVTPLYQMGYETGVESWKSETFETYYQGETFIYHDPEQYGLSLSAEQENALRGSQKKQWDQLQALIKKVDAEEMSGAEVFKQTLEDFEVAEKQFQSTLSAEQRNQLEKLGHLL